MIPRAALLLVTALPDLRNTPAGVVGQTAVRLLTSYAISQDQEQAGVLREQLKHQNLRVSRLHAKLFYQPLLESIGPAGLGVDLVQGEAAAKIDAFTTRTSISRSIAQDPGH